MTKKGFKGVEIAIWRLKQYNINFTALNVYALQLCLEAKLYKTALHFINGTVIQID